MAPISYTLLGDGSGERCLLRIIDWVMENQKSLKRELNHRVRRVAESIEDLRPLRKLAAFAQFEEHTKRVLDDF